MLEGGAWHAHGAGSNSVDSSQVMEVVVEAAATARRCFIAAGLPTTCDRRVAEPRCDV